MCPAGPSPGPPAARTSSRRPAPSTFLPRQPRGRRSARPGPASLPPSVPPRPAMKAAQAPSEEAPGGARSVKVVLVGDGGCGKTSLLMVFAEGAFPEVSAAPGASCLNNHYCPPQTQGSSTKAASSIEEG